MTSLIKIGKPYKKSQGCWIFIDRRTKSTTCSLFLGRTFPTFSIIDGVGVPWGQPGGGSDKVVGDDGFFAIT